MSEARADDRDKNDLRQEEALEIERQTLKDLEPGEEEGQGIKAGGTGRCLGSGFDGC